MKNDDLNNRIMLVDDDVDITTVLKIGLEDNGFTVDTFNDPVEALSNFKAGLHDLLLIDIKMPKMNGYELYQEIKKVDDKVKIEKLKEFLAERKSGIVAYETNRITGKTTTKNRCANYVIAEFEL